MKKKTKNKVKPSVKQVCIYTPENTAILEYLDAVKHEYDCAAEIKTSFENRAGILLTLLGAVCIFLFEKVKVSTIVGLCSVPLTWTIVLQIVFGFSVYICFTLSMLFCFLTIRPGKRLAFEPADMTNSNLEEPRYEALVRLIATYIDSTNDRKKRNEHNGKLYGLAVFFVALMITSTVIFISL